MGDKELRNPGRIDSVHGCEDPGKVSDSCCVESGVGRLEMEHSSYRRAREGEVESGPAGLGGGDVNVGKAAENKAKTGNCTKQLHVGESDSSDVRVGSWVCSLSVLHEPTVPDVSLTVNFSHGVPETGHAGREIGMVWWGGTIRGDQGIGPVYERHSGGVNGNWNGVWTGWDTMRLESGGWEGYVYSSSSGSTRGRVGDRH